MTEAESLEILAELREMRAEMATKADIARLENKIDDGLADACSEMKSGFIEIRAGLKAMGDRLCKDLGDLTRELDAIRREVEGWKR